MGELAEKRVEIKVVREFHEILGLAVPDLTRRTASIVKQAAGDELPEKFTVDLAMLTDETNRQIELGADDILNAEDVRQEGFDCLKTADMIRLQFTSPAEQYKKLMIAKVRDLMKPLFDANVRLFDILKAKEQARRDEERRVQEEHDRKVREAAEAARKQTETNKAISKGMIGGDASHIKTVEPEAVPMQITYPTAKVTSASSRVDKDKIEAAIEKGVRSIPGVEIKQVWTFSVMKASDVPEEYRTLK